MANQGGEKNYIRVCQLTWNELRKLQECLCTHSFFKRLPSQGFSSIGVDGFATEELLQTDCGVIDSYKNYDVVSCLLGS